MPKLTVIDRGGDEHTIKTKIGENLQQACIKAGIDLPSSCGGGAWCGTCVVNVLEGKIGSSDDPETSLSEMEEQELETMKREGLDPKTQVLSCSCQIWGDAVVQQPGF